MATYLISKMDANSASEAKGGKFDNIPELINIYN